jgi:cation diffusion facilitator family transporter
MSAKADSVRSILYALGANLAIAAAKTAAALATGSSAMLAEAIHSFADSGNQGLLLWGMRQAKRPPSPDYPLGWGKAVFFWSFVVALVLFCLGGVFSLYEGWHKLQHPQALSYPWVAVGVLVFGLVAETVSLRACLAEVNKVRGGRTLWRWFRESRQSELVVILGEDLAALLGLALALCAVLVAIFSADPAWDALGSMAIGVVLIVVATGIAVQIKGLLIGRSAEPETEARLREFLERRGEVEEIYKMITMQLGTSLMVAVKARMKAATAADLVAAINRTEAAVRAEFPEVQWLFFEPDVAD